MWRERFLDNFEDKIVPALRRRAMNGGDIFVFKRMWEVIRSKIELTKYYFAYCEAGFATKTLGDVIVTVARENTLALLYNC
jgi:cyclopropane-fatty-acyl-phospholipid synthase